MRYWWGGRKETKSVGILYWLYYTYTTVSGSTRHLLQG